MLPITSDGRNSPLVESCKLESEMPIKNYFIAVAFLLFLFVNLDDTPSPPVINSRWSMVDDVVAMVFTLIVVDHARLVWLGFRR